MAVEGADDDTVGVICVEAQSASIGNFILCLELGPRFTPILCNPVRLVLPDGDSGLGIVWMRVDGTDLALSDILDSLPFDTSIGGAVYNAGLDVGDQDGIAVVEVEYVGRQRFEGCFLDGRRVLFGSGSR